jgi:hypothetical protein
MTAPRSKMTALITGQRKNQNKSAGTWVWFGAISDLGMEYYSIPRYRIYIPYIYIYINTYIHMAFCFVLYMTSLL